MQQWYLSLCMGGIWSAGWIAMPPIESDKYHCRMDTVIFSWWWAHGCPKHVEKRNKYIKQDCAPGWTYLWDQIHNVCPFPVNTPKYCIGIVSKTRKLLFYRSIGTYPKHQLLYTLINISWFSSNILEVRDFILCSFLGCKFPTITGTSSKLLCLDVSIIRDKYLTLLMYSQICCITKETRTFTAIHLRFVLENVLFISIKLFYDLRSTIHWSRWNIVFDNVECKLTFLCNKFTFLHFRMPHKIWPFHTLNWRHWSTKYFAVSPVS